MASWKQMQSITAMWAVLSMAAGLLFVSSRVASAESPEPKSPSPVIATATPGKVPPVPVAGPLAGPRSLKQVGLPIQQTLAEVPADNPQTSEKIALGEKLFFEPRLSADGTVAGSPCTDPARAFTDGTPIFVGVQGRVGQRNAPTVLNALYNKKQFWDGRTVTLEEQATMPITNPSEMGQTSLETAVATLRAIAEYKEEFERLFGQDPTGLTLVRAIAAYERTLLSFDSSFDHFIAGDPNAIDDAAKRGWVLFNAKAKCNRCHASVNRDVTYFTDFRFHNIGIGILRHNVTPLALKAMQEIQKGDLRAVDRAAIQSDFSVLGRFLLTRQDADVASFKTPTLRNVLVTAPYFHDGSMQTLWDAVDHYNKGDGLKDPWLDDDIDPLARTEDEIDDLVAFMASLTSPEYKEIGIKEFARQRDLARTSRPERDTARAFGPKPAKPKVPSLTNDSCHP